MKKWILRIGVILVGFILISIGLVYVWFQYSVRQSLPQISGQVPVSGIKEDVEIIRDNYGVPHIYAQNEPDLYFALGYAIAGLLPSSRVTIAVGNIILVPMGFLSGAYVPIEIMPDGVRSVSQYFPLTHVVNLMRGLWHAKPWSDHLLELAVLCGMFVVCAAIVALTFRWE